MCAAVSSEYFGVDVCVDEDVLLKAPCCPHGPTLLFERYIPGKQTAQQYYACSACRDRKDCGFFQLYSDAEIISEAKKQMRQEYNRSRQPWKHQMDYYQRLKQTEELPEKERRFCFDCQLLILPDENHARHRVKTGISSTELARPSYLMDAIQNNKTNAQYLFSTKAVKFLVHTLKSLGFSRVLCVGVPRLHEYVSSDPSSGLSSLLLDIDHRYGQFYPLSEFCRYNMFNHCFLDGAESQKTCSDFLARGGGEGVVMVTDPPFGGLVQALASGVKWLMELWKSNIKDSKRALPVMWIFPYFLEHRILESLPELKMLDYKIDYDNHPLFKGGPNAKKKGSPVRIFTNLAAAKIELPTSEGYRLCKACERYVASENVHCKKCDTCPSKNGTTYRHCDSCDKCVKPSFSHCEQCGACQLPGHECGQTRQGCHMCGALDHKRRDCPKRNHTLKRQHEEKIGSDAGKTRTWPKRMKKRRGARSPLGALGRFGPVGEEEPLGTPNPASTSASSSTRPAPGATQGGEIQDAKSSRLAGGVAPLSSGSLLDLSTVSTDVFKSKGLITSKSLSSLVCDTNNNGDDDDDSGTGGFQSQGGFGSLEQANGIVDQRPLVPTHGHVKSGTFIGHGKTTTSKTAKQKIFSKKQKLMQRIQKMRMKRKIKLKL